MQAAVKLMRHRVYRRSYCLEFYYAPLLILPRAARDRDLGLLPRWTQSKRSSRKTSHSIYGRGCVRCGRLFGRLARGGPFVGSAVILLHWMPSFTRAIFYFPISRRALAGVRPYRVDRAKIQQLGTGK